MEPFSIVATSATLALLCSKVSVGIYKFTTDTIKTNEYLADFRRELDGLARSLKVISDTKTGLVDAVAKQLDGELVTGLKASMSDCHTVLEKLDVVFASITTKRGFLGWSGRTGRQIRLSLKEKDILEHRMQVQAHAKDIQLVIGTINLCLQLKSNATIADILEAIRSLQTQIMAAYPNFTPPPSYEPSFSATQTLPIPMPNNLQPGKGMDHTQDHDIKELEDYTEWAVSQVSKLVSKSKPETYKQPGTQSNSTKSKLPWTSTQITIPQSSRSSRTPSLIIGLSLDVTMHAAYSFKDTDDTAYSRPTILQCWPKSGSKDRSDYTFSEFVFNRQGDILTWGNEVPNNKDSDPVGSERVILKVRELGGIFDLSSFDDDGSDDEISPRDPIALQQKHLTYFKMGYGRVLEHMSSVLCQMLEYQTGDLNCHTYFVYPPELGNDARQQFEQLFRGIATQISWKYADVSFMQHEEAMVIHWLCDEEHLVRRGQHIMLVTESYERIVILTVDAVEPLRVSIENVITSSYMYKEYNKFRDRLRDFFEAKLEGWVSGFSSRSQGSSISSLCHSCEMSMIRQTEWLSQVGTSRYEIPKSINHNLSRQAPYYDIYDGRILLDNSVIFGFFEPFLRSVVDFFDEAMQQARMLSSSSPEVILMSRPDRCGSGNEGHFDFLPQYINAQLSKRKELDLSSSAIYFSNERRDWEASKGAVFQAIEMHSRMT